MAHLRPKVSIHEKDHGWKAMWHRIDGIKHARVKVGVLADSPKGAVNHPGRKGDKPSALTVAQIAAILHYGTRNKKIPARPFLSMAFDANREELADMGAKLIVGVLLGQIELKRALNIMGAKLAGEAKGQITAGLSPPNAMSTALSKAMKGRSKNKIVAKDAKSLGEMFSQLGATAATARSLGTPNAVVQGIRFRKNNVRAAKNLAQAFGQIGALASVKPLIDTGRLLNAITWMIDDHGEGESHG